jgi:type II secretory pathway pseudopilin PulG
LRLFAAVSRVALEDAYPQSLDKTGMNCSNILGKCSEPNAFTIMELMVAICILLILTVLAFQMYYKGKSKAMGIIAVHDLETFAKIEQDYFLRNDSFAGNPGESIRNDSVPSDFLLDNFKPSPNIVIKIISGDPENPYSDIDPFIVEAKHVGSSDVFEYDFKTQKITKR